MEYNKLEQNVLDQLGKTNFKNLKKNDAISLVSKLDQMDPEVAKEIIAKFPEFASLLKDNYKVCNENILKIMDSDDKSLNNYYKICDKELESLYVDCEKEYAFDENLQKELSEELGNTELTFEQRTMLYDKKIECHNKSIQYVENIRNQQKDIRKDVDDKDNVKRVFDFKTIGLTSIVGLFFIGAAILAPGGNSCVTSTKD